MTSRAGLMLAGLLGFASGLVAAVSLGNRQDNSLELTCGDGRINRVPAVRRAALELRRISNPEGRIAIQPYEARAQAEASPILANVAHTEGQLDCIMILAGFDAKYSGEDVAVYSKYPWKFLLWSGTEIRFVAEMKRARPRLTNIVFVYP